MARTIRERRRRVDTRHPFRPIASQIVRAPHPQPGGTSMREPGMAARRGVWALARFLHRNHRPGEKEKNALAGCRLRPLVPKLHMPNALRSLDKAFFPFSPASGTHGAQKRAKAHIPGLFQDHTRVSFIVPGFPACGKPLLGGTGFPACGKPLLGGTGFPACGA